MAPKVHAPDGGMLPGALCEDPNGDVNLREQDVDCGDCLDLLETADPGLLARMISHGWQPTRVAHDEALRVFGPRTSGQRHGLVAGLIAQGRKTGIISQRPE